MSELVPMSSYLTSDNTKKYLEKLLGNQVQTFITSLATMVGSNEQLNKCERASLLGSALKATSMKLPFDQNLGFAYVIPYGTKGQFQIGYKGFIQLALRTNQVSQVNAREVVDGEYKGDDTLGEPIIEWLPVDEREKKEVVGYMAGIKLTNGFTKIIYWCVAKIEKHADRYSQAYRYAKRTGQKDAVWLSNFDAMAKKTVLKDLLSKYAPMSVEMQEAIKYDQAVILTDIDNSEEPIEIIEYVDKPISEKEETINKAQIKVIAGMIGNDEAKNMIIFNMGYKTISDIPKTEYENVIKAIQSEATEGNHQE